MFPQPQPPHYHDLANPALLRAVPAEARRFLDVGCGSGALGAALKDADPTRVVYGLEENPAAAGRARERLDDVFVMDVERGTVPLPDASLDCLTFGDVLEHLENPEAILRRLRGLLRPTGTALCSIPNVQHHSVLAALLCGDFPYTPAGLLDATHLRFFTSASFLKLMLDAGYAPDVVGRAVVPADPAFLAALEPALRHFGLHPERTRRDLETYQSIVAGSPLSYADASDDGEPVTVTCCVSDERVLAENLLASPDLQDGTPHEILCVRGARSAADGLNFARERASRELVIAVRQDVYLPRGWVRRFADQWRQAERQLGPLGVVGVYGVEGRGGRARRAGRVVVRDHLLGGSVGIVPTAVDTLDELVLGIHRRGEVPFDPELGWHCYGADACLTAKRLGLSVAVLDAVCLHNCRTAELPPAFAASARVFAHKWRDDLPITTCAARIDASGRATVW